jgi:hypothetical protein
VAEGEEPLQLPALEQEAVVGAAREPTSSAIPQAEQRSSLN